MGNPLLGDLGVYKLLVLDGIYTTAQIHGFSRSFHCFDWSGGFSLVIVYTVYTLYIYIYPWLCIYIYTTPNWTKKHPSRVVCIYIYIHLYIYVYTCKPCVSQLLKLWCAVYDPVCCLFAVARMGLGGPNLARTSRDIARHRAGLAQGVQIHPYIYPAMCHCICRCELTCQTRCAIGSNI